MNAPVESMETTLYELLGIRPDASRDEIDVAYRAAARRLMPQTDAGRPDALARLRLLREAYQILSDDEKRAHYDASVRPLQGHVKSRPRRDAVGERLGLAIIIALVLAAIAAMLMVFLWLDRAVDLRIEQPDLIRQQPRPTGTGQTAPQLPSGEAKS